MSADLLRRAATELRATVNGVNGNPNLVHDPEFKLAVADLLEGEADAHLHLPGGTKAVYDMPGMDDAPAVRAARAYLGED